MKKIIYNEIRRTRFGLMIWSVVVGILVLFSMLEYPVLKENLGMIEDALSSIPKIGQLIFGVYNADLTTHIGYHIIMYYWIGLVVFTHAIYTGVSIISKESRDKTAEYLFTKPYKRCVIIWAKIIAGFINVFCIGIIAIIVSCLGMLIITDDPVVYMQVFLSGIGMFFTQCILFSLGLLCSAFFKTYKTGTKGAVILLVSSYCMMFFVQYFEIPLFNFLSPLTYFGVADVTSNGFNIFYVLLLAFVVSICLYLTQRLYAKKVVIA